MTTEEEIEALKVTVGLQSLSLENMVTALELWKPLVESIPELIKYVKALEARVTDLESKLATKH